MVIVHATQTTLFCLVRDDTFSMGCRVNLPPQSPARQVVSIVAEISRRWQRVVLEWCIPTCLMAEKQMYRDSLDDGLLLDPK